MELIGLICVHWTIILLIWQYWCRTSITGTNIFRIQAYDSVMHGYYCIEFIGFMHKDKRLTDFSNVFSPNNFKKNDDMTLKYFKNE